jgi:cytidyltransferase-like protein
MNISQTVLDSVQWAKDYADENREMNKIALVCITWDLTHIGHIDYINTINKQLRELLWEPYKLLVWVEADEVSELRKNKTPIYSQEERRDIFQALKWVDHAFISYSEQDWLLPETRPYASTLFINPDVFVSHEEHFDDSQTIFDTVTKLDGRKFLLIGDYSRGDREMLRYKYGRSTSNTILSIIQQHGTH